MLKKVRDDAVPRVLVKTLTYSTYPDHGFGLRVLSRQCPRLNKVAAPAPKRSPTPHENARNHNSNGIPGSGIMTPVIKRSTPGVENGASTWAASRRYSCSPRPLCRHSTLLFRCRGAHSTVCAIFREELRHRHRLFFKQYVRLFDTNFQPLIHKYSRSCPSPLQANGGLSRRPRRWSCIRVAREHTIPGFLVSLFIATPCLTRGDLHVTLYGVGSPAPLSIALASSSTS